MSADETARVLGLAGLGSREAVSMGEAAGKVGGKLELAGGLRVERTARELQFVLLRGE